MSKKRQESINKKIHNSSKIIDDLISLTPELDKSIDLITKCFKNKNKVILFGNGGSAADAQHIAAEFIGRFCVERQSLPAIALTSNSSTITALGNDYSFEEIFSRQCESLVKKGDIVFGISTSGKSKNIEKAFKIAKERNAVTIGLLGNKGGTIKKYSDIPIIVESSSTPRIQEMHRLIYHIICENVEKDLAKK